MKKRTVEVRVRTGITGLDEVLHGGFLSGRTYLVRGGPGTGKTMLGLHFLQAGALRGERTMFITVEESTEQIRKDAASLGFDLSRVAFVDLTPGAEFFSRAESYDIFNSAEVEREPMVKRIVKEIETHRPDRVFLEAMTQFRYLTPDPFQYHKQVLSLLRFLEERGATVLFTSEGSSDVTSDEHLQFLSDGVVHLESTATEGRGISVTKFRGSDYCAGRHSVRLTSHGMEVYPRLVPGLYARPFVREVVGSGIQGVDDQLHGGIERGTVTVLSGPTGVGKTTLGMSFLNAAVARNERACVFLFEEAVDTMIQRSEALAIPARAMIDRGLLTAIHVEPQRYGADELACLVRTEVERNGARVLMLDSIAGYRLCVSDSELARHLHALSSYLRNMGVVTILVNEIEVIAGPSRGTSPGISHMADNVIFLRYLELGGRLERAIGVLKKRVSGFDSTLRELEMTPEGLRADRPLTEFSGILTSSPELIRRGRTGRAA